MQVRPAVSEHLSDLLFDDVCRALTGLAGRGDDNAGGILFADRGAGNSTCKKQTYSQPQVGMESTHGRNVKRSKTVTLLSNESAR